MQNKFDFNFVYEQRVCMKSYEIERLKDTNIIYKNRKCNMYFAQLIR